MAGTFNLDKVREISHVSDPVNRPRRLWPLFPALLALALLTLSCGEGLKPTPLAPSPSAPSGGTPDTTPGSSDEALVRPGMRITLTVDGLNKPVDLQEVPDGQLLVAEQGGRLLLLDPRETDPAPTLIANVGALLSAGGERGLLGIALHPQFGETSGGTNRESRLYLNYTRRGDGATVVAVVEINLDSPSPRLLGEPLPLLVINQPYANHNAGEILFRADGRLVIPTGDGGSGGDPENRAQDPRSLLGKILLLDAEAAETAVRAGAAPPPPLVWMSGLRNPWRAVFDPRDGALWVTDVGQSATEEVTRLLAGPERDGANLGWRLIEGDRCYEPTTCSEPVGYAAPIGVYRHDGGACSISGGALANDPRGARWFLFTDWCDGQIRAISADLPTGRVADPARTVLILGEGLREVSGIITDRTGRVWLLDHGQGQLLLLTLQ